jgi:hypothetical protein
MKPRTFRVERTGPSRSAPILRGGLMVMVVAGSFWLGRATSRGGSAGSVPPSPAEAEPASEPRPGGPRRLRPPALTVGGVAPAPECETRDHRATAASLVESVFGHLPGRPGGPGADVPETSANAIRLYVQGVAEAVKQTSPAVRGALAEEFTARVCGGSLRDDQLITMAYLGLELPDITSPRAFDCVFSQRGTQEDVVLWNMLDAWRHSGQEKTTALAQIERSATDPRTQRRFLAPEMEAALRAPPRGGEPR